GNVRVRVNKSLAQSNDLVSVTGFLNNTGTGTVTVNNVGPALAVGNRFVLFSQPVTGGESLTVSGGGAGWTNKLAVGGSIQVLSTAVPQPRITAIGMSAGSIVFSGTNGSPNGAYQVLSTTNLTIPLSSWGTAASGSFDINGNFSVTNAINP